MKNVFPGPFLPVLAAFFLHAHAGHAAIVSVPNPNFELPGNAGSISGIVGGISQPLGSGPWSAASSGNLGLLGPDLAITPGLTGGSDGVATLTGLSSVNIIQLLTNSGEFFQVLAGVPLQPNTVYRLSADITTSSPLSLAALSNSGVGIGVGTILIPDIFKSTTAPSNKVTLVSAGMSGRLSFEFTTPGTALGGNARLRLYGGDYEGTTTILPIPNVTFDNVVFEIIPEPSAIALLAVGSLGFVRRRRA